MQCLKIRRLQLMLPGSANISLAVEERQYGLLGCASILFSARGPNSSVLPIGHAPAHEYVVDYVAIVRGAFSITNPLAIILTVKYARPKNCETNVLATLFQMSFEHLPCQRGEHYRHSANRDGQTNYERHQPAQCLCWGRAGIR